MSGRGKVTIFKDVPYEVEKGSWLTNSVNADQVATRRVLDAFMWSSSPLVLNQVVLKGGPFKKALPAVPVCAGLTSTYERH